MPTASKEMSCASLFCSFPLSSSLVATNNNYSSYTVKQALTQNEQNFCYVPSLKLSSCFTESPWKPVGSKASEPPDHKSISVLTAISLLRPETQTEPRTRTRHPMTHREAQTPLIATSANSTPSRCERRPTPLEDPFGISSKGGSLRCRLPSIYPLERYFIITTKGTGRGCRDRMRYTAFSRR